jgi:hypothetical protein
MAGRVPSVAGPLSLIGVSAMREIQALQRLDASRPT